MTVAVSEEATAGTEAEMQSTVLRQMTDGIVPGAGMHWKMTDAMTAAMTAEALVVALVAGGADPAVVDVGRNGSGMTAVGVG